MRRWSVRDVMTREVVTVDESAPYKEIVKALAAHAIAAVPVVAGDGRVIGVVSEADLLHKLEDGPAPGRGPSPGRPDKAKAEIASDLMSAPPIVVGPSASVSAAARLMETEGVKWLPVVDRDGSLVGVVSRRDLLRVYLRDDWEIREEIVTTVLVSAVWTDPSGISVHVDRGVVTLGGAADASALAPVLLSMVGSVVGVVDVIDKRRVAS